MNCGRTSARGDDLGKLSQVHDGSCNPRSGLDLLRGGRNPAADGNAEPERCRCTRESEWRVRYREPAPSLRASAMSGENRCVEEISMNFTHRRARFDRLRHNEFDDPYFPVKSR